MQYSKIFVLSVLISAAAAVKISVDDSTDPLGRIVGTHTWEDMKVSGYNGADEDEIMDSIFSRYSKEGRTSTGHKTGQKLLMKDQARLAAGTILEAAHKLRPSEVPNFLQANFEDAWNHFD